MRRRQHRATIQRVRIRQKHSIMFGQAARLSLLMLVGTAVAQAAEEERSIWACSTEHTGAKPILYLVEWGSRSYVRFAHMRFSAAHETDGERQGWHWDNQGEGYYRYGVLLDPDGTAWLHDFSNRDEDGMSEPLDYFRCRQTR